MRRKTTTDRCAGEKRWAFSFDLKEESEDECLTERGREFQITGHRSSEGERWALRADLNAAIIAEGRE